MHQQGGCLCGNIRYVIDAEPVDAGFCHCSLCQRSSGAPAVAWMTLPYSGFSYTEGKVATYPSSEHHQREFCPRCGTQLAFRAQSDPQFIDITLCSLDDNRAMEPGYHIWCASKVPWLHINDDLPRYPDAGPDSY